MVSEDDEVPHFQRVAKMLHGLGFLVIGLEPSTLGTKRAAYVGAWVAAAWGRNRLYNFSMPKERWS
jgi:hypothetical protein